jgi:hypothetical protein
LLEGLLNLIELFAVPADKYDSAVLASSNAVVRPMPEVGPVMIYALRFVGLLLERVFGML